MEKAGFREGGPSVEMQREESRARRFLRACAATTPGVRTIEARGGHWFHTRYLPALRFLEAQGRPEDRSLLAENWYIVAGIHWLNGGYGAAAKASIRALELAPDEAIGSGSLHFLLNVGLYEEARQACRRFLEYEPDDPDALEALADIDQEQRVGQPDRDLGSWETQVGDLLAEFRAEEAIRFLRARRSLVARQWKARAHGALGHHEEVLRFWRAAVRRRTRIEVLSVDWFYLPEDLYESAEFWALMLELIPRWGHFDASPVHAGLERLALANGVSWGDVPELMFKFYLARATRDTALMRSLNALCPDWPEAAWWARHLGGEDAVGCP